MMFDTAEKAVARFTGSWKIKPGIMEQTFQITFFAISNRLDSLRTASNSTKDYKVPLNRYITYTHSLKEITLLPTLRFCIQKSWTSNKNWLVCRMRLFILMRTLYYLFNISPVLNLILNVSCSGETCGFV